MTFRFIKQLQTFIKLDFKRTYFRGYFLAIDFLSLFLTILIYYFSSKAFVPKSDDLNFYGTDLFGFLLWGDILLRIPQNLFYSPIGNLKDAIRENTFDSMVIFSGSSSRVFICLSVMEICREFISVIFMLFCAHFIFNLPMDLFHLLKASIVIISFLPFFISVGLIVSSLVLWFERGENFLYVLSSILAILAGMYFPTEVFPQFIVKMSQFLSPFTSFLKFGREAMATGSLPLEFLSLICISGGISTYLGLKLVNFVLNKKKTLGQSLIIG